VFSKVNLEENTEKMCTGHGDKIPHLIMQHLYCKSGSVWALLCLLWSTETPFYNTWDYHTCPPPFISIVLEVIYCWYTQSWFTHRWYTAWCLHAFSPL